VLAAALVSPLLAPALDYAERPSLPRHSGLDPESTFFGEGKGKERWMPDQVRHDKSGITANWDRACERFRAAEAALSGVAGTADDDLYDRALGRFNDALRRLLRTPAPDLSALADKLDLIVAHEVHELTGGDLCLAAVTADARRFASASRG
jgi:hypothetical protein